MLGGTAPAPGPGPRPRPVPATIIAPKLPPSLPAGPGDLEPPQGLPGPLRCHRRASPGEAGKRGVTPSGRCVVGFERKHRCGLSEILPTAATGTGTVTGTVTGIAGNLNLKSGPRTPKVTVLPASPGSLNAGMRSRGPGRNSTVGVTVTVARACQQRGEIRSSEMNLSARGGKKWYDSQLRRYPKHDYCRNISAGGRAVVSMDVQVRSTSGWLASKLTVHMCPCVGTLRCMCDSQFARPRQATT
jgi:hypothetical protein